MKLSLTLIDQRSKPSRYGSSQDPEVVDYERVAVEDITANAVVVAGLLRSVANEIDPPPNSAPAAFQKGWAR
jgi:hypothetical protein